MRERVGQELVNTTKYASAAGAKLTQPSFMDSLVPHCLRRRRTVVLANKRQLLDTLRQAGEFHDAAAYLSLNGWLGPEGPFVPHTPRPWMDVLSSTVSVSPPLTFARSFVIPCIRSVQLLISAMTNCIRPLSPLPSLHRNRDLPSGYLFRTTRSARSRCDAIALLFGSPYAYGRLCCIGLWVLLPYTGIWDVGYRALEPELLVWSPPAVDDGPLPMNSYRGHFSVLEESLRTAAAQHSIRISLDHPSGTLDGFNLILARIVSELADRICI
ncbi:hypothetical protein FHL15_008691 [Xylaria flabelliformis]|uniref:Uncharacterized protein n=1 Tax=Xylaria flabelliformis TaxID=2512241 RepID=A0A553HQU2_9PEZI|nr:hypothetical protein FHL15_008691 [Xylaria flabelliformis]